MTHHQVIFFAGERYDRMTPELQAKIDAYRADMNPIRPDGTRRPFHEISAYAAIAHAQNMTRGLTANRARALEAGASPADTMTALRQIDTAVSLLAAGIENTPAGRAFARWGPAEEVMGRHRQPMRRRPVAARRSRPANWVPAGVTGLSEQGQRVVARATAFMLRSMKPHQVQALARAGEQERAEFAAALADFAEGVLYYYVTGARS